MPWSLNQRPTLLLPDAMPPVRPMRRWLGMVRRQDAFSVSRRSVVDAAPRVSSDWLPVAGGITAPKGFRASGITAGLKAAKPDLALVLAPEGACLRWGFHPIGGACRLCGSLRRPAAQDGGGQARAVLINSGQANACTGDRCAGLIDSQRATQALADRRSLWA